MASGDARLEVLSSVLIETAWLAELEANAKPARAKLLQLLGLPPPRLVGAAAGAPKAADQDAFLEYKALVGEMGY